MSDSQKPKVLKANMMLQAKIGTGAVDEKVVEKCQEVMDSNTVDFQPMAEEYLKKLAEVIEETKAGKLKGKAAKQAITEPIMQLKANAATFRYTLAGNLANIILSFLEAIDDLDDDVLQIVDAHFKTLSVIIAKKMQGDAGAAGKQMESELKAVCQRYFSKTKIVPKA